MTTSENNDNKRQSMPISQLFPNYCETLEEMREGVHVIMEELRSNSGICPQNKGDPSLLLCRGCGKSQENWKGHYNEYPK